jgi:hypothetical protein
MMSAGWRIFFAEAKPEDLSALRRSTAGTFPGEGSAMCLVLMKNLFTIFASLALAAAAHQGIGT